MKLRRAVVTVLVSLNFAVQSSACGDDAAPAGQVDVLVDGEVAGDEIAGETSEEQDTTPGADADTSALETTINDTSPDVGHEDIGPDVDPGDVGEVDPGEVDPGDVDAGDVDPGDVDTSADEALCWETGGAWVDGACDCQQDGYTTNFDFQFIPEHGGCVANPRILCETTAGVWQDEACNCQVDQQTTALGYHFDPRNGGCIPDASRLCGATGGVWEDDACQCAQDGASLFYEFFLHEGGCRFPDDRELAGVLEWSSLIDAIELTFDDKSTVWLIDRPGAFDVVKPYDSAAALVADIAQIGWDQVSAAVGTCDEPLRRESLPTIDCDSDLGVSKEGCFLAAVRDEYHRVSFLMQAAVDFGFGSWSEAQIEAMVELERRILLLFTNTEHGVTLAFVRSEGRWVLVVVDLSQFSCSA